MKKFIRRNIKWSVFVSVHPCIVCWRLIKMVYPLGNAITWADNRAKKEAQELKNSSLGKNIYTATGTPIHPMSPLIKITWIKNNDKERFKQDVKFLSIKSYIIQQLTGEYLIDYSLASATGLLNIHKIKWEPDALDYAGITADMLPELVPVFAFGR